MRRAFAALCVLSMLPAPARACSDGPETEALTWTSATTLQAVLAPTGTVVRFDPAAALWSPGRAGLGAFDVDVAFAGERLLSIRVSGRTQAGCVPGRLTLREGAVDGRPRARLSWRPSEYTGGLTLSPSGQLAFLYTSPVMSEFGDSGLLIVDLGRGRFAGEVRAAKDAAWWSDSEIISVDDTSTIVTLHSRRGARWMSEVVYRTSEPGAFVRVVPEASGRVVLFERSSAPRFLVAERNGETVRWEEIPTRLEDAPNEVSLTAGIAVGREPASVSIRAIGSAEPIARVEGAEHYSRAALSPDGQRLAVIAHAFLDGTDELDGEATLHVFELGTANHWVWGRAPRSVLVQHAAPSMAAVR